MNMRSRVVLAVSATVVAGLAVGLAAAATRDPDPGHENGRSGWVEVADQP